MKSFYSILSAAIRPETNEKVSLGLLFSDGNNSFFDLSKNKLAAVHLLVNDVQFKFIKEYNHGTS